jgi:adenosylcobinamide-phosphate synthase
MVDLRAFCMAEQLKFVGIFPLFRGVILAFIGTLMIVILAWGLDRLLGEPKRFHPLVGFGRWVNTVESRLFIGHRPAGVLAWLVVMLPCWLVLWLDHWLSGAWFSHFSLLGMVLGEQPFTAFFSDSLSWDPLAALLAILLVYLATGCRSLIEHAEAVAKPLFQGDLEQARTRLSYIVSRDVAELDERQISSAAVETVLENGCDAVFAAWFWFLVAGIPGIVLYRLSNTLDAMWGYKNDRYLRFGWAAARIDDVLNFVPARLTALVYCLAGNYARGRRCWKTQARDWKSPNAGPVMTAGAGSLSVLLGGGAVYHGQYEEKPHLGCGDEAGVADIARANALLKRSVYWWFALSLPFALLLLGLLSSLTPLYRYLV